MEVLNKLELTLTGHGVLSSQVQVIGFHTGKNVRPATPLSSYGTTQLQKTHWKINTAGDVYSENPVKRQIPMGLLQTSGSGGKTNGTTPTTHTTHKTLRLQLFLNRLKTFQPKRSLTQDFKFYYLSLVYLNTIKLKIYCRLGSCNGQFIHSVLVSKQKFINKNIIFNEPNLPITIPIYKNGFLLYAWSNMTVKARRT